MTEPKEIYEKLKTQFGEECCEAIMDRFVGITMGFIRFLADEAQVSFEIMCQALILTEQQRKQEDPPMTNSETNTANPTPAFAYIEAVKDGIEQLNDAYKHFCNEELPAAVGVKSGCPWLTPGQWFRANTIIANRGFKAERMEFLNNARSAGWDVKINMQTLELIFCGRIE